MRILFFFSPFSVKGIWGPASFQVQNVKWNSIWSNPIFKVHFAESGYISGQLKRPFILDPQFAHHQAPVSNMIYVYIGRYLRPKSEAKNATTYTVSHNLNLLDMSQGGWGNLNQFSTLITCICFEHAEGWPLSEIAHLDAIWGEQGVTLNGFLGLIRNNSRSNQGLIYTQKRYHFCPTRIFP